MKLPSIPFIPTTKFDIVRSFVATIVGLAGSFAFVGPTTDFIVTPINSLVVRITPGYIVIKMIQLFGKMSELLAFVLSSLIVLCLLWLSTIVGIHIGKKSGDWFGTLLGPYFISWGVTVFITKSPLTALAVACPLAITVGIFGLRHRTSQQDQSVSDHRRKFLKIGMGLLGTVGISGWIGLRNTRLKTSPLTVISPQERKTIEQRLQSAQRQSFDIDGIPGLVSSIDNYYEVDINTVNPNVSVNDWSLTITGAVEHEEQYRYEDLTRLDPEHRFITLRCVGDPLNGQLMDNALWTGIPLMPLIEEANPAGTHVMMEAVDGYYVEFPLEAMKGSFLAYGMNGRVLPWNHGYPVRAHILGHWGEVNVKWVHKIKVLKKAKLGYWERRGWHGTGPVNTIAKLWTVNHLSSGGIQIGGHAYAGTRGIDQVEVSIDGGNSWNKAELTPSLSGADTWRQWKYEWIPTNDQLTIIVRAIDGKGNLQPRQRSQPYPSGATGWVRRQIDL
ncbi:MAG: molybdopterin-dependent oxidoreductase [Halobacteriaceae archaeon]